MFAAARCGCCVMSFVKPLCVLCERPAADGAVQAVQVDKEKLQTWFLNVCEEELAEEIEDDDLICFFCIWHAEFLAKHVPEMEDLAWWPANLDFLDGAAKQLRKKYFEGKAEQCWVQLENIELPEREVEQIEESYESRSVQKKDKKCFYCGKQRKDLTQHMQKKHKDAIRCEYRNCVTYFHTVEEKEKHIKEEHEKSRERKMFNCMFCKKQFSHHGNYRDHIVAAHPEYSARCDFRGCFSYFKTKEELKSHIELTHKKEDEAKVFKCHSCKYKTNSKTHLSDHISCKHLPKTIKCTKCDKMFATKQVLVRHVKEFHTYWVCTICSADCIVQNKANHLKRIKCKRCKNKFECSGLCQAHLKTCKETLFECDQCPKSFQKQSRLMYHMKRKHGSWRGLQYKMHGFKCEPCKRYYPSANYFKQHLRIVHTKQESKQCAHCPKRFSYIRDLKTHLAETHDLIERKFCCGECGKCFFQQKTLNSHRRMHLKTRVSCSVCGKFMKTYTLNRHLTNIHGIIRKE